jgi:rod shape-determining protein MreD
MLKKILILILGLYFLTLLQTSFSVFFDVRGMVPNLVFIAVIFFNLFTSSRSWWGEISAFAGGFYLDVFSFSITGFFGLYTLILVSSALFIRFIFKRHVKIPVIKKL